MISTASTAGKDGNGNSGTVSLKNFRASVIAEKAQKIKPVIQKSEA